MYCWSSHVNRKADTSVVIGSISIMATLKCARLLRSHADMDHARNGVGLSSNASSIVGPSSLYSNELGNTSTYIRRAWRAKQLPVTPFNSCFCFIERMSHNTLELTIMADVEHKGGMRAGVVWCKECFVQPRLDSGYRTCERRQVECGALDCVSQSPHMLNSGMRTKGRLV